MKVYIKGWSIFFSSLFVLSLCFTDLAYAVVLDGLANKEGQRDVTTQKRRITQYAPGQIIIKLKEKETPQLLSTQSYSARKSTQGHIISALKRKYNLRDERPVFKQLHARLNTYNMSLQQLRAQRRSRLQKARRLKTKASHDVDLLPIYTMKTDRNVIDLCEELKQDPDIEYAEPDYIVSIDYDPNDPLFEKQWALDNHGQDYPSPYGTRTGMPGCDIDAPEAWDVYTGTTTPVIAVLDTGVDYNHPDISANMWQDDDGYYGYDFYNNDPDPIDDNGHGTHCAGIIAAGHDNGVGIAGICPNTKIMALKFLKADGKGYTSHAVDAFYYAVENGASIISNSWGGGDYSDTLQEAIGYAHSQGLVIIAAAGNDNTDLPHYPASYDNVIAVSATTSYDQRYGSSNYGNWIDIAAPGVHILSLRAYDTDMYALIGEPEVHIYQSEYYIASGTSMACPHVSGLAALLLSHNPSYTNDNIIRAILLSADNIGSEGWDEYYGFGRINAHKALDIDTFSNTLALIKPPGFDDEFTFGETILIKGTALSTEFSHYTLEIGEDANPANWTSAGLSLVNDGIIEVIDGDLGTWDTSLYSNDKKYTIKLTVFSYSGSSKEYRVVVDFSFPVLWKIENKRAFCPALVDIDGNNQSLEVIFSSYVYHNTGELLFEIPDSMAWGLAGDFDYDGIKEIITGYGCYSALDGSLKWDHPQFAACPAVSDLNDDGILDLLAPEGGWRFYCFDGYDGSEIWHQFNFFGCGNVLPTTISDVDYDGKYETFVIGNSGMPDEFLGGLGCYDHNGQEIWKYEYTGDYRCSLIGSGGTVAAADINNDGVKEIFFPMGNELSAHDGKTGSLLWKYSVTQSSAYLQIHSAPAIADLDNNGTFEIVFGCCNHYVYCLNATDGSLIWQYQTGHMVDSSPAIADTNNDGILDIVIGSLDTYLYLLSGDDGSLIYKYRTNNAVRNPVIADIDFDGKLEIVFASDTDTYAIRCNASYCAPGAQPWPMFHHDLQHTGLYRSPEENNQPDISAIPDALIITEGDAVAQAEIVLAVDPDGDVLTYTYSGWLTSLPYTTSYDDVGEYILHVEVSDGIESAGKNITITVNNANRLPDISAIPDSLTKNEGDVITVEEIERAIDPDGDTLTHTYSGWLTSLPYTIAYDDAGEHVLHVDVSDGTDTVGKDITITVNNIIIAPPTVSLTLSPSTVQVGEEITITVGGESPLELASVWWWVKDMNNPDSRNIPGTIDGVSCNLATAHDCQEGRGKKSHSYTRTVTITALGEYEFGANSRDILYGMGLGEPHQASEGEGMAFELVTVEGIDFEAVRANDLLWTFNFEELSLLPGPIEEQVWRFGYAERGGCTGWRHAASRLRSPTHEFPSEKEYNITLTVKAGGVTYTKTKAIYID